MASCQLCILIIVCWMSEYEMSNAVALKTITYMMDNVIITIDGRECYIFPPKTIYTPLVRNISCTSPVQGRIVRFSRNMTNIYLIFCEVQVWACKPGMYGKDCNSECNCLNNDTCDNYHGSCTTGCSSGFYGFNCTQKCGRCKDMECNSTTGYCLAGCQTGWKQPMCNACSNRMYGPNCSIECGHCLEGRSCNATNGACPDGCEAGYNTTLCNEKCSDGYYGINCSQTCGKCKDGSRCNMINGQCLTGCESGWKEPMCTVLLQQTNDHDLTGVIAGSVVGAGLLIGGAIVTAVLIWLTLNDKRRPQPLLEDKETQDDLGMENLNFYENAYGKLETHEDVARPYENLGK